MRSEYSSSEPVNAHRSLTRAEIPTIADLSASRHAIDEVRAEIEKISPTLVLDLAEICAVDVEGVRWLNACQSVGIKFENCAPYIREWMRQEKA